MVGLLRRLFIKDYQNLNDPRVREKHGLLASGFGIFTNLLLVVAKLAIAFVLFARSNFQILSVALLADALNNVSDMASSLIVLLSFRLSQKPADKKHPYGHQRSEYIGGLIVSILIVVLALLLLESSITSAIEKARVSYDILAIGLLAASILLKLVQGYFNFSMGRLIKSQALKATALDSFFDALSTSLILISAVLSYTLLIDYLDPYMGIAVSLFVLYGGIKMLKEAISPLLGEASSKEEAEEIIKALKEDSSILGVHDLIVHDYGPSRKFIVLHIEVDGNKSLQEAHAIADNGERMIKERFHMEATIHVDPISIDEGTINIEKAIQETLDGYHAGLSYHGYEMKDGKIFLELLIPFDCPIVPSQIQKALDEKLGTEVIFTIDHPFTD